MDATNMALKAPVKLPAKILGFRVVPPQADPAEPVSAAAPLPDENPLTKRIRKRPAGYVQSNTCKMEYRVENERHVLYFVVSFLPVNGRVNGQDVRIERPLEVFIPPGQRTTDQEWIAALMRNLSLHARAGTLPEALADLREVVSTQGPVQLLWTPSGKNKFHDSVVSAFAYMVQALLIKRGFLDDYGRLRSVADIEATQRRLLTAAAAEAQEVGQEEEIPEAMPADESPAIVAVHGFCKEKLEDGAPCGGVLQLKDGCLVCPDCLASRCS